MRALAGMALSFFLGAFFLSLFSTVQKILVGYPLIYKSYLVPVLAGGVAGSLLWLWPFRLKREREKVEHLNLVLHAMGRINRLMMEERDAGRLLRGICEALVENRGYYNAWIAVLDENDRLVQAEEDGLGEAFSPLKRMLERGELTDQARKALGRPGVVLTDNPSSTCTDCPLSPAHRGRCAMTTRLGYEDRVYGLLSVSIPRALRAHPEEYALLENVASDIAFGLYRNELEEKHRQDTQRLREKEHRFRKLTESCLIGICVIQNNRIVYQNPENRQILGQFPEVIGEGYLGLIHPDDREKVREGFRKALSGEIGILDMDFRLYPVDPGGARKQMKWVHCRANLFTYHGEKALFLNLVDLTQAKEMEALLRVQDKMSSLGRVAAGIAHEIRNPLSGINIYLKTLEKITENAGDSEKIKSILDQIQSASNKIESVIRRVMDFSRPGAPVFSLTDINTPVREAVSLSQVTLRKTGIALDIDLKDPLPKCLADPYLLEQVVLNLITNAAESMKDMEGVKKIAIASSVENGRVRVTVADSGPGIPEHLRDKILDPFYSTKNGSTGIGLSIAHRIIADHGGALIVSSSPWGGAEFAFEIPVAEGAEES